MDHSRVVYEPFKFTSGHTHPNSATRGCGDTHGERKAPPSPEETTTDSSKNIRSTLRKHNISRKASNIILAAWRHGTHKQYSVYIQRWYRFCLQRQVDSVRPEVAEVLEFLTELFESGLGYSAINTARCALSQILVYKKGYCTYGAHPWVVKFLRGVYNLRPPIPRYVDTWDVSKLLKKLKHMSPTRHLSMKELTLKTVSLVAIVLAARGQTLAALNVRNMTIKKDKICFTLGDKLLKQSRPGYKSHILELREYSIDKRVCVYHALTEYLKMSNKLRGKDGQLFISYHRPYNKVCAATIGRWIKMTMNMAGIDVTKYKAHSVRAASTSKAWGLGVPLEEIMQTAGWSSARTFAAYYNKDIVEETSKYAEAVIAGH